MTTIWITNYDGLIEEALRGAKKKVDVKLRDTDIGCREEGREVVLYKMHGDVAYPEEVIISKDDYERYARTHPIFQNALEGDLLTKTFLFLGFSFIDPNLAHMLGHLRSLMPESERSHYTVMQRVRLNWTKEIKQAEEDFRYETVKQKLHIENLERYTIRTHLVDERYPDITEVLEELKQEYAQRIIYLWGRKSDSIGPERLAALGCRLGARLLNDGYKLCCDPSNRVGRAIFAGAKLTIDAKQLYPVDRYLLRPLPTRFDARSSASEAEPSKSEFASASRKEMIRKSGFVIFLGGSDSDYSQILEDFEYATEKKVIPIPVGGSGSAARTIWKRVQPNLDQVYGRAVSPETFNRLNEGDPNMEFNAILDIIGNVRSKEPALAQKTPLGQRYQRTLYEHLKGKFSDLPDKTVRGIVRDTVRFVMSGLSRDS